jgi:triacylglycerol lipase
LFCFNSSIDGTTNETIEHKDAKDQKNSQAGLETLANNAVATTNNTSQQQLRSLHL